MEFFIHPFVSGFATTAGLIIAIGAQNAFVLKQGIIRNHVLPIISICIVIDIVLVILGVQGFGAILRSNHLILEVARFCGVIFLAFYGSKCFLFAFKSESLKIPHNARAICLKEAIVTTLAVSLLNPHVYLDTCLLIGTIGAHFPRQSHASFIVGSSLASFVWFVLIGYGARVLEPIFKNPIAWKVLDYIIGTMMWCMAIWLCFYKI